ncbi:MAG: peptidoglycan editing factor PgeF [Vicinamibacteria bacterium]
MSAALFFTSELGGIGLLQCRPLIEAGATHAFTTRAASFGSREQGTRDPERLSRLLGFSGFAQMQQVHGNDVRSAAEEGPAPSCDGLVTDRKGVALLVKTADCVPLLFWASERNAAAAVHAGWRGTISGIAGSAVRKLVSSFGASTGELHVALGPAIRVCCYEVGDEVIERFRDPDLVSRPGPRGRQHLDLVEVNRRELLAAGVPEERIYDSGRCTSCENHRFYSFRKEGSGVGRLFGLIGPA